MKIMTSYFYQIRNMTKNMIPLSTAVGDPAWFHNGTYDKTFQYKDKNGVWNGLRADPFVPDKTCEGLCRGPETCNYLGPHTCAFLKTYRAQLDKLDFDEIMDRFEKVTTAVQETEGFEEEPVVVLIFHEKYDNPCSERWPVQAWFKDHGIEVEEFNLLVEKEKEVEQKINFTWADVDMSQFNLDNPQKKVRGLRRLAKILEDRDFF